MIKRRTLLGSILFLPTLTRFVAQQPPSTTIPYNCDFGETAFAAFYFPYPCTFFYSWGYIGLGRFISLPMFMEIPEVSEIFFWFTNGGSQQVQEFTWRCSGPASFTFGTCVI